MGEYKYKAFISYSHKDRKWTRWLHRRLETYPIPKNIIGNVTPAGIIPRRLKPIFRDREELSASNSLGEKIEAALASSENLIIICSPAAAKSKWVNQEILTFKRNNRDAQLFSVIVEGEPYASSMPGREDEECFPPALRYEVNADGSLSDRPAEPLAADLRPHADGKRLGALKLISGMIGVGLDEVVQRDMKRGRKRVTAITMGSLATVLAMGTLTGFALDARSEAERRRAAAEGQIEFMLTELRGEVEKVGRLDALNVVALEAESYYLEYPPKEKEYEARARQARVYQYLGEIQISLGSFDKADEFFGRSYRITKSLLLKHPKNPDRVFDHAQSIYYVGLLLWEKEEIENSYFYFDAYIEQAALLQSLEPNSLRSLRELTYAYTNLAIVLSEQANYEKAASYYEIAVPIYRKIIELDNNSLKSNMELANAYLWLADNFARRSMYAIAKEHRKKQISTLSNLIEPRKTNKVVLSQLLDAKLGYVKLLNYLGEKDEALEVAKSAYQSSTKLVDLDADNLDWRERHEVLKKEISSLGSN